MVSKKRNYYGSQKGQSTKNNLKVFLLRYEDLEDKLIKSEGPFADEGNAKEKLNSLLKEGICSWLVTYNE